MKTATEIASKLLQPETKTSTTTSTQRSARALTEPLVAALFRKFGLQYGNLWTSQLATQQRADDMLREWSTGLAGVTADEIKTAIANLPDMPPTLPQFRRICRSDLHAGPAYVIHRRQLPKPKADPAVVAAELAKMRQKR